MSGGTRLGITKNDDRCTYRLTGGRHILGSILRVRRLFFCKEGKNSMRTRTSAEMCNNFLFSVSCESPGFLLIPDRLHP